MRITGVRLIAEVWPFKRGMKDAAGSVRVVKDEVDDVGKSTEKLGDTTSRVVKSTRRDYAEMYQQTRELDRQIKTTQAGIASLAKGFASTGDVSIFKAIQEQQRTLSQLKNVRSLLPDPAEVRRAGAGIGGDIVGGIRNTLSSASPQQLGIGAMGLLLAPTLGAAVSGAVIGGAAGLGVVGGIALAARDERVKQAGQELGAFVLGDLERRSAAFVPATLAGIDRIRAGWQDLGPDLDRIFKADRFVAPLVEGAVKGVKGFIAGFADLVDNADPVVESLRNLLADVGTTAGSAFSTLSQDAKEGASAVNDLTIAVDSLIVTTANIVHGAAAVKGFTDQVDIAIDKGRYWLEDNGALADAFDKIGVKLDLTADGFKAGSVEAEAYRKATIGTATAADFATLKAAGMSDAHIAAADASGKYRAEVDKAKVATQQAAIATGTLIATEGDVTTAQKAATLAQQDLNRTIAEMGPNAGMAAQNVDGLRKATDALYGAQERGIDANEGYQASWDALSASVKENGRSLDVHTKAGRANRDALEALLVSSRDMYYADIDSGMAIDQARQKHVDRTKAIVNESGKLKINDKNTKDLIKTYGNIPPKRETDLILDGVKTVVNKLMDLYVYQRSLAEGVPIGSIRAVLNKEKGPAKKYGGYSEGGYTGPGSKHTPAGVVHADEYVIQSSSRRSIEASHPGLLQEMNATGQMPGYEAGGWVGAGPVETRDMRYTTDVNRTKIPTKQQVAAKVVVQFSKDWPPSPAAQRGDSGVWRRVVALIRSTGPLSGTFGNAYRPGDPLWHGSGRAVDWMGYNQDALATFLSRQRPLELIHRTNKRDYAYTRGVNKGSFNNALMQAHRNHVHIAMQQGGLIDEPIVGMGASGRTYSFGEGGRKEWVIPAQGGGGPAVTNVNINMNVPVGSHPREIGRQVVSAIGAYLQGGGELRINGEKVL